MRGIIRIMGRYKGLYLASLILGAAASGARGGLFSYMYKNMFNRMENNLWIIIMLVIVSFAQRGFQFIFKYSCRQIKANIRRRVFHRVIEGEVREVESSQNKVMSCVNNHIPQLEEMVTSEISSLIYTLFGGTAALFIVFTLDLRLALTGLIINIIFCFINMKLIPRIRKNSRALLKNQEEMLKIATYVLHGNEEIKMFSIGRTIFCGFERLNVDNGEITVDNSKISGIIGGINVCLRTVNFGGIMVVGLILLFQDRITIGVIIGVLIQQDNIQFMFLNLSRFVNKIQKSLIAFEKVRHMV